MANSNAKKAIPFQKGDGQPNVPNGLAAVPFSQEAEEAVDGAVLMGPEVFFSVNSILRPEMFYVLRNGYIWEAFERIVERDEQIDYLTVQEELDNQGRLKEIGGPAYLTHLMNSTPTSMHAEVYAHLVKRAWMRRMLLLAADEIKGLALDEQLPIEKVIDESNQCLFKASDQQVDERDSSAANIASQYFNELERLYTGDEPPGIPTGLAPVDEASGGVYRREVTVVAGPSGFGKTTLLLTIAQNNCRLGLRVAIFSNEMTRDEIMRRLTSMETGIPESKLKKGKLTPEEWSLFVAANGRIAEWNLNIVDDLNPLTPLNLKRRIRKLQYHQGLDLVIVDGLRKMKTHRRINDKEQSQKDELSLIIEDLVDLARQVNLPLLLAHHFHRIKGNKRPTKESLFGSSTIEALVQVIWALHRDNYDPMDPEQDVELFSLKVRAGDYFTSTLKHDKKASRYYVPKTATADQIIEQINLL